MKRELSDEEFTSGIDFEHNAKVSRGDDDGAYVQAWVWVSNPDADEEG